jgi:hypothetical protein
VFRATSIGVGLRVRTSRDGCVRTMAGNSSPSTGQAVSKRFPAIKEALGNVVEKTLKRRIIPLLAWKGRGEICGGFIERGG